jgi:hypothetical protein
MNSKISRIGGIWCVGTTGWGAGLAFKALSQTNGSSPQSEVTNPTGFNTLVAIDTDESARTLQSRLGPEHPFVYYTDDERFIIPDREISDLRDAIAGNEFTSLYSQRLSYARGNTKHGAAGEPIVGLCVALPEHDRLDSIILEKLKMQRDHKILRTELHRGNIASTEEKSLQIVIGYGGGGTMTGVGMLITCLLQKNLKLLGYDNSEIVALISTPTTTQGNDWHIKFGNFLYMLRQICLATDKPQDATIHTFHGDYKLDRPLFDRIYLFGCSSGHMTLKTRQSVEATMGMCAYQMMSGSYAAVESYFRDFEAEASANGRFGPRIFAKFGYSLIQFEESFNRRYLAELVRQQITSSLLRGQKQS